MAGLLCGLKSWLHTRSIQVETDHVMRPQPTNNDTQLVFLYSLELIIVDVMMSALFHIDSQTNCSVFVSS